MGIPLQKGSMIDGAHRQAQHRHVPTTGGHYVGPDDAAFSRMPRADGRHTDPSAEGLPQLRQVEEIRSPELGVCSGCGTEMRVLSAGQT